MAIPLDQARALIDPSVLHLIIMPTEHCNFRCTYCYEDFGIGRMSVQTVQALKNLLNARQTDGLRSLHLSWFGGEPLLAADIVQDVSDFARKTLVAAAGGGFFSSITTNGYLLSAVKFDQLVKSGVSRFQITLDGSGPIHNRSRRRADGAGTFDRIWQNLIDIAHTKGSPQAEVSLRLHYDMNSAYELSSLVEMIKLELIPTGLFSVEFHEISRLGGRGDAYLLPPSYREREHIRSLIADTGQVHASKWKIASDTDDYICYAAHANSFVVRADGRIGKCTVALRDDKNTIGILKPDGSLEIDNGRLKPWIRGLFSGVEAELACPLMGIS